MNRAQRRREARERGQRHRLNSPSPFGGVAPRKQHGRVLFVFDAVAGVTIKELNRNTYPSGYDATRFVWPTWESFATTVGVAEDHEIEAWASGVPARTVEQGTFGELVLIEGWCEHIRDEAAATLGFLDEPAVVEAFEARPDGWLVLAHMPAGVILGDGS